jgi:hypothetical protein
LFNVSCIDTSLAVICLILQFWIIITHWNYFYENKKSRLIWGNAGCCTFHNNVSTLYFPPKC